MPKLSIIVPVYKVEKYLRKCIDSILSQTFTDFELILVDDGSPDSCPRICEEYKDKDNRVVLIHKENGGLSDARNVGLGIAKGLYLAFVDSDDYVASDMYEKLIGVMTDKGADLVICDNYRVLSDNNIEIQSWLESQQDFNHKDAMRLILNDRIGSQAWNKLYKRDIFEGIRYPVGRTYEDIATTYRYVNKCNIVSYIKEPLYYYLIRDDSISFQTRPDKNYNIFTAFIERYHFAKLEYPEFAGECLSLVVEHGILTCYNAIDTSQNDFLDKTLSMLTDIKSEIIKCKSISVIKRIQILLAIFNSRLFYKLQKKANTLRKS